ncbi:DUF2259 domain-containing protein [Coleofasciculus sp. G2-EDA-02]|uniref:DUF2259 domain-containing protein n=1 Tax=Coleofasciculus sp. G2-EDA-02 TaxID=3069529 RepID=UPI0032F0D59D
MKIASLVSPAIAASVILFLNPALAAVLNASVRLAGFSPDNRHYIYLETYRDSVTEVPTAHLQIINIPNNSCVRNGCLRTDYDRDAYSLSNQAAENDLLQDTLAIRQDLQLNRLKVGIKLPVIDSTRQSDDIETVTFRLKNQPLQIRLEQRRIPSLLSGGTSPVARASMRLIINYQNQRLTLGSLNNYRDAVKGYGIREVRLSPNRNNIVVLLDMLQPTHEDIVKTTLVQSFSLEPFGD